MTAIRNAEKRAHPSFLVFSIPLLRSLLLSFCSRFCLQPRWEAFYLFFFFWNRVLLLSCTSAVHRWVSIPCTNFPRMPRMKWEPVDMKSVSTHDILTHKNAPSSQPAYVIRVSVSCVNKRKKRHFKNKSHSKSKKRRRRRKYSMLLENYNSVRWKQKGLGCIMRCKLGWWACGRVCVCVFTVLSPPLLELWWPKNGSQCYSLISFTKKSWITMWSWC